MIVAAGIVMSIFVIVLITVLLLKRQLAEKYAVLWLVIAFGVLIVSIFPGLLEGMARLLGVQVPSNLIFAAAIALLIGVALHLSWELSRAEDEIRRLAEDVAILATDVDDLRLQVETHGTHESS